MDIKNKSKDWFNQSKILFGLRPCRICYRNALHLSSHHSRRGWDNTLTMWKLILADTSDMPLRRPYKSRYWNCHACRTGSKFLLAGVRKNSSLNERLLPLLLLIKAGPAIIITNILTIIVGMAIESQ